MELTEFISQFADLFEDTDTSVFTGNTRFRDLEEWNSFLALGVMAMIKSNYDVAITAQEMRNAVTINDLFLQVNSYCK